jgi:hypothetical protein
MSRTGCYGPERKPQTPSPAARKSPGQETHMGMTVAPIWMGTSSANLATWAKATIQKIAAATLQKA